jgi:hypothetical protein
VEETIRDLEEEKEQRERLIERGNWNVERDINWVLKYNMDMVSRREKENDRERE